MNNQSLLIFSLGVARFAVDACRVRESIWLPELSPVEEAPPWVAGMFDLRGAIVPVIDLRLRFGHAPQPYRLDDRVVVLDGEHRPTGIVVSDVIDVVELPQALIQPPPLDATAVGCAQHLIVGEASIADTLVSVLDAARLTAIGDGMPLAESSAVVPPTGGEAESNDAMRACFRARAAALRAPAAVTAGELIGLAVVELGGERFGVELARVREFCDVVALCPIPCCPPHILGAINLRGDLVTLIDPRGALKLPPSAAGGGKAVIGSLGERAVGIAVDAVHDVVYLRIEEMQPPPPLLRERGSGEIAGVAPCGAGMMTVLDLPALLARTEWIVDETV